MKFCSSTIVKKTNTLIPFFVRYAKGAAQAQRGLKVGINLQ
jgi:hypothetical protein